MRQSIAATALLLLTIIVPAGAADERYEHHKGVAAETLQQAVTDFSEYNTKLEVILSGNVDDNAMHEVHELTYTLENALEKINDEVAGLAETLEELHQASERMDGDAVRKHGHTYLDVAREVIQ